MYQSNGYMAVQIMADPRPTFAQPPSTTPPTSDEFRNTFFGYYHISDKTHVEQNESALTLIADIPGGMDFRRNGPRPCGPSVDMRDLYRMIGFCDD